MGGKVCLMAKTSRAGNSWNGEAKYFVEGDQIVGFSTLNTPK
jgi:hypothetical protein